MTTLGSGSFTLYNAGPRIPESALGGLISTVAYQLGPQTAPVYALEGSVRVAGSVVEWLKTNMGVLEEVGQVEAFASQVESCQDLHFVPAFNGHQSPRWM